jgi:hypothetical protein
MGLSTNISATTWFAQYLAIMIDNSASRDSGLSQALDSLALEDVEVTSMMMSLMRYGHLSLGIPNQEVSISTSLNYSLSRIHIENFGRLC